MLPSVMNTRGKTKIRDEEKVVPDQTAPERRRKPDGAMFARSDEFFQTPLMRSLLALALRLMALPGPRLKAEPRHDRFVADKSSEEAT